MNVKVLCNEFADGFIRGSIDWRRLDFDFEAPVGLLRYAFTFTACMYFDIYSHDMR